MAQNMNKELISKFPGSEIKFSEFEEEVAWP
jgi:hypothetical protein